MFSTGKQKLIRTRRLPFVILTAVTQVFIAQHLFVKSQIYNGPLVCALWQILVPVISTGLSMYLKFEAATLIKILGVILCVLALIARVVLNEILKDETNLYFEKFFLILQVLFLSGGAIMQK